MPGPFDPEWLHGPGTALVHGQAVGEVDDLVLCAVNDQHGRGDFGDLVNAGEGVKAVRFPGVGESHTQSRHQRRMENHRSTLIPGGQVYRGDRPNALTIQDDILGTYAIPGAQRLPRGVDVGVEVLLGGLAGADAVAGVVVGEDVAVDARAQADVEAAHLAQVHRVAVREEQRVAAGGRAAHEHAA